jgi:hypothetical protein
MTTRCGRVLACVFLLLAVAGCARDSADAIITEQIAAMEEVITVLDSIKDDASAAAAMPRLEKACARARRAHERAEATPKHALSEQMPDKAKVQALIQTALHVVTATLRVQAVAPRHAAKVAELVNNSSIKEPGR